MQETLPSSNNYHKEEKYQKESLNNSYITNKSNLQGNKQSQQQLHTKQKSVVLFEPSKDLKSNNTTFNDINSTKPENHEKLTERYERIDSQQIQTSQRSIKPDHSQKSLKSSESSKNSQSSQLFQLSQPSQYEQYSQSSSRKKTDDEHLELFRDLDSNKILTQSWKKLLRVNSSIKADSILK